MPIQNIPLFESFKRNSIKVKSLARVKAIFHLIPDFPDLSSLPERVIRSFHRIRLLHACRRVYFHSRLEIADHQSNIIIAMTGVARASERAQSRVAAETVDGFVACDGPRGTRTGPDNVTSCASSPRSVAVSRFPAFEEVWRNPLS